MRARSSWLLAATFCLTISSGTYPAYAQKSSSNAPYSIPITVRRVVLDVVVRDVHHHAVNGLKARDFTVADNRQRQKVLSFREYNFEAPEAFHPVAMPELPPDTFSNVPAGPDRGPLYVIVWDAVDTQGADQEFARQVLQKFLKSKPAGTRFELYMMGEDLQLLQGFTTNPNQLLAAFDVHRKNGPHIPFRFLYGANSDLDPFSVMAYIGHTMEGLPGRKNLIWMASSFPSPGFFGGAQDSRYLMDHMAMMNASSDDSTVLEEEEVREASNALNAGQVSVYPIDVSGLNPDNAWGGIDFIADQIANDTGGKAYYNNNDIGAVLKDAVENGASYYEISYAPSDSALDGKLHTLKVTLADGQRYSLQYRQYYFADDPNKPMTKAEKAYAAAVADHPVSHQPGDTLYAYMQHGAPESHQILFRLQVHAASPAVATPDQMADLVQQPAYFVVRRGKKPVKLPPPIQVQRYTIDYLVIDATAEKQHGQVLEFAAGAFGGDGKLENGLCQNAVRPAAGDKAEKDKHLFRAEQTLDVPVAAKWLRVAVRDIHTDRIGTLEIPLPLAGEQPGPSPTQAASAAENAGNAE